MTNGLVPQQDYPAGADYAARMRNLVPARHAAINPTWFTAPFTHTLDWPFPQLFRGEDITLLFGKTTVSTVASDWVLTALTTYQSDDRDETLAISAGGPWHVANFEDIWFATNGVSLVFQMPAYNKALVADGLTVQSVCSYKDRLFMVGLAGDWFAGTRWQALFTTWRKTQPHLKHDQQSWSTKWAVWGAHKGGDSDIPFWFLMIALGIIGTDAFDRMESKLLAMIEQGQLGFVSIRKIGDPLVAKQIGDDVAVYSTEGRVLLRPAEDGEFMVQSTPHQGCTSRGAVSGDEGEHAWIDPLGEMNAVTPDGALRELEQGHLFTDVTDLVSTFDPLAREHWFSTLAYSYALNRYGVGGPLDVRPTALARINGSLYGAGYGLDADPAVVAVELYGHDHNMGYQGLKQVSVIQMQQKGLTGPWVDVKASDVAGQTPYSIGAVQANDYDYGYPARSGDRFQCGGGGAAAIGATYAINGLTVHYRAEDRSGRRGAGRGAEGS